MNKDEVSLLLYLETRAVDHSGKINNFNLNDDDRKILQRWVDEEFVESGRIAFSDTISTEREVCTSWVKLSDKAFRIAHSERMARANRLWKKRTYKTTKEKQENTNI